eukprot:s3046_g3.t1
MEVAVFSAFPWSDVEEQRPKLEQQLSTDIVRQALRLLWHCGNCPQGRCLPTALLDVDDKAVACIYGNLDAARAKLQDQARQSDVQEAPGCNEQWVITPP